eukprot:8575937-Prorocentrum_lima.AAC.1
MTSSLVGSEMCIRDSIGTLSFYVLSACRYDRQGVPDTDTNMDTDADPSPVSYTHLTLPTICSV